ncbi:MAG: hypothetical protein JSR21_01405 [Proteobacteria bacterium]|nr:hypothetical protein [Pseudomonadota bacterium]
MSDNGSKIDNTGTYYSVDVPAPDMQSYLRLGQPDSDVEKSLSAAPKAGTIKTENGFDSGVLLYTQGHYQTVAPAVTTWSGDTLSAVRSGNYLVSASYVTPDLPYAVNYSSQLVYSTTFGNVSNFVTGNQLAYWLGNSASTGVGGLLWSNVGLTQNVFAGQIVNVISDSIDVQGWREAKGQVVADTIASTSVGLAVSPATGVTVEAIAGSVKLKLGRANAIVAAILAAGSQAAIGITGDITADPDALRIALQVSGGALGVASTAVLLLQAVVASSGLAVKAALDSGLATDGLLIGNGQVELWSAASKLILTPNGIYFVGNEVASESMQIQLTANNAQHWPG